MMSDFVALAEGLDSRQLIPANKNVLDIVRKNPHQDYYTSLYTYKDKHVEEFKQTKSLKGIKDVKTRRLFFDFDNKVNPADAQKDAIEVVNRLLESGVPESSVEIYFSGNKGVHINIPLTESLTRQEFVNIVFNIAGDLQTFDVRINDEARIIREPFSQHPESKLYKIPIVFEELKELSIPEIRAFAKDIKGFDFDHIKSPIPLPEILSVLKTQTFKKIHTTELKEIKGFDVNDIDFSKCPKWLSRERFALLEGFFYGSENVSNGERNIAFMILASTFRNQGFSEEHALALLEATAEKQAARTKEDIVSTDRLNREVIATVYNAGWKGGIYPKDEPLLVLTRERFKIVDKDIKIDLVKIDDVGIEFRDFAKNIDKNTVKTGLKSLDDSCLITSGMMVSLLAAPGAGKTSFANKFVEHLSMQGEKTIFFSLDMYKNLLFTRLLQKYSGYSMQRILNLYKDDRPDEKLMNAYSQVLTNYSNTYFNFKSGPTVEEIDAEIVKYKDTSGNKPKLVVVDYLEKVRGPFVDATANSGYVASRLSDIAKKHDLVVLLLVQPQKAAGDPREELISYRKIKGASVIEQDSRVIMTLSRPGYNPADMSNDKFATIAVVKNNMGNLCQLDYRWDGVTGELYELEAGGVAELRELREEIAKSKAISGFDDGITASGYRKK